MRTTSEKARKLGSSEVRKLESNGSAEATAARKFGSAEARKLGSNGSAEARKFGSKGRAEARKCGRREVKSLLVLTSYFLFLTLLFGCSGLKDAREIKNGPMPKKYYANREPEPVTADGSLWQDRASLYEDRKARRVNDLLTIIISETTSATKKAGTNAKRTSTGTYGVNELFGANLDFGAQSLPLLKQYFSGKFTPSASGTSTSAFAGAGDTSRTGTLTATITAKVVEVLPNANMIVESRKEVIVNNEKEIVVLRGMVRPEDISTTNTVSSAYVADAQIYLVGDGVLDDKQSQGWLVRFLDQIWPF